MKTRVIFFIILSYLTILQANSATNIIVTIDGNKIINNDKLHKEIGIEDKSWFEFYKDDNLTIKTKYIKDIDIVIKNFYASEGFYDTEVSVKKDKFSLNIKIKENKFIKVDNINISTDIMLDVEFFKKNQRFSVNRFKEIKSNIKKEMLKQGYCAYKLNNKAYVDLDNYSVDLVYTLHKGDICKFGKISVEGLTNIDSDIVFSRINIFEGENFNIDKIKESYNKLYGLDAFSSILIDYNQNQNNIVPLDIFFVQKRKTSNYKIGFGYDSNLGPKASLKWWKDNFMGDAQKLSFRAKLAKDIYDIKNTFYHPILFKVYENNFDFTNSLGYKVEKYNNYVKAKTLYEKFKFGYSNKSFNFYTGFGLENIDLYLEKDDTLVKEALNDINSFIIYPYLQAIYDKRDSKLNPKNGYYLSGLIEYGLPYNDNASSYTKIMAQGRYIKTVGDLTLATVAKVGFINELKNLTPDSKKFFAGGSFSNRAYGYNDLGVILSSTSDANLSGVSAVNLSFEGDYPIVGDLSGAIFSDISMVSDKESDISGSCVTTVGAGIRYLTPMGPLKVDAGFNIHDASQYGIQFRIGQSF